MMQYKKISFYNRALRQIWAVVWLLFFRTSLRSMHCWRVMILKVFGAKIGTNVHVYPSAKIWAPWNLTMKDYSCLADDVNCYNVDSITIGESSTISQYSFLCSASHDYSRASMPLIVSPIVIGKNVWITSDVFVGPGVTIHDGSVVTARSTVLSDLPAWYISKGNPAVPVKPRKFQSNS